MKTGEKVVFMLTALMIGVVMVLYVLGQMHVIKFWTTNDVYVFNQKTIAGYEVFKREGCKNCHVLYGDGDFAGPDLDGEGTKRTRAWIEEYMKDPHQVFVNTRHDGKFATNFKEITPQDKQKLLDLLTSTKALPGSPNYPKPPQ